MEAAAEGIICMETKMFGNVGPAACIEPPKRATQTAGHARPANVLHFGSDQRAITSCRMSVEAAEEDEFTLENSIFGNARPAACIGPPKRPIHTVDHAGQSNVLRFGSDQWGIDSCRRSVEAAEEEIQCIEENDFGNVGPAACTGPQKRPLQAAGHGGLSFVQRFGSGQRGIGSCRRSMEAAEEEVLTMGKSVSENARPPACTGPPRMPTQTAGYAGPSNVLHSASDQAGIASYRMSVEAAEEEVQCIERNGSGNLRPVACTRPPKRSAQIASHTGPSDVLCFGSDQCGIGSCRRFVEAAEEQVQCMERNTSGNVRPAASTGPPERPTQVASHIGISMGTPGVVALV